MMERMVQMQLAHKKIITPEVFGVRLLQQSRQLQVDHGGSLLASVVRTRTMTSKTHRRETI